MDNAGVSSSTLPQTDTSSTPAVEHRVELGGPGPFSGLVICITGLSKEARKQVMEVTVRLGGIYSPTLHPKCTHLLVQGFRGKKLEHALKHGIRNGLFVVTLGWFVESVRKNTRLCEFPYMVYSSTSECKMWDTKEECEVSKWCHLLGHAIYIDPDISAELHSKVADAVIQEGGLLLNKWFVGCGVSYVVCEASSIEKYIGHGDVIVSPMWVLKTSKERSNPRCVRLSADLARQVGSMLENTQHLTPQQEQSPRGGVICDKNRCSREKRVEIVKVAKCGVKKRRTQRLQSSCGVLMRPIGPSSLLESVSWSISDPPSKASVYDDDKAVLTVEQEGCEVEASFVTPVRPLTEIEKNELIFKNHFVTVLFPLDRFAEMGPSSRTYFSETRFSCMQLLEFVYEFYQEDMLGYEIEAAIHTDSRYAEQLRSMYCGEGIEMRYKRVDFLGSRKSFEMLKRVSGENNGNVYELVIRA